MEFLKETPKGEKFQHIFCLYSQTRAVTKKPIWSNFDTSHPSNQLVPLVFNIQIRITTGWADMNLPAQECLCCREINPGSGQEKLVLKQKLEMWGCTCHFKSLVFSRSLRRKSGQTPLRCTTLLPALVCTTVTKNSLLMIHLEERGRRHFSSSLKVKEDQQKVCLFPNEMGFLCYLPSHVGLNNKITNFCHYDIIILPEIS